MGGDVVVGLEHFEGNGGAERMKDRGAALLERSTNPILMIRLSDGLVVETNEALFMMTGFNRRELLGRSAQELVIPVRPPSPAVALHVLDSLGSVADIPAGSVRGPANFGSHTSRRRRSRSTGSSRRSAPSGTAATPHRRSGGRPLGKRLPASSPGRPRPSRPEPPSRRSASACAGTSAPCGTSTR
jgi:PAS domain-containing protein